MALRALDGNGAGSTSDIADAVRYAALEGAGVINLSLGGLAGGSGDPVFFQAVQVAQAADAVVVAAAGNAGSNNDSTAHGPLHVPRAEPHLRGSARPERRARRLLEPRFHHCRCGRAGHGDRELQDGLGHPGLQRGLRPGPRRLDEPVRNERMGGGDARRGRHRQGRDGQPGGPIRAERRRASHQGEPARPLSRARLPHALRPEVRRGQLGRPLDRRGDRRRRRVGHVRRRTARATAPSRPRRSPSPAWRVAPTCTRPSSSTPTLPRRPTAQPSTTCAFCAAIRPTPTRSCRRTTTRMRMPAAT